MHHSILFLSIDNLPSILKPFGDWIYITNTSIGTDFSLEIDFYYFPLLLARTAFAYFALRKWL